VAMGMTKPVLCWLEDAQLNGSFFFLRFKKPWLKMYFIAEHGGIPALWEAEAGGLGDTVRLWLYAQWDPTNTFFPLLATHPPPNCEKEGIQMSMCCYFSLRGHKEQRETVCWLPGSHRWQRMPHTGAECWSSGQHTGEGGTSFLFFVSLVLSETAVSFSVLCSLTFSFFPL
jgi:hypothetical protein